MRYLIAFLLLLSTASAVEYVRSTDGNDADDGSTWALAHATLADALTDAVAGDVIYVSQNHAETQGSAMTLTSAGTAVSPIRIICVNDAAEPPTTTATTATVTVTGNFSMTFNGFASAYGITFNCSTGNSSSGIMQWNSSSPWWWRYENCALRNMSTSTTVTRFGVGFLGTTSDDSLLELINTTIEVGGTTNAPILPRCRMIWRDTPSAIAGATTPTTLFNGGAGNAGNVMVSNVDLSAMGSGENLVTGNSGSPTAYYFENCKLGASVAVASADTVGQGGINITLVNCDSGDTNYRYYKQNFAGVISTETTIVKTSPAGATDGTTPISRKMVTNANAKLEFPLESDPIVFWNETLSSTTITIPVITDNVTLTDAQAWVEVSYLGTSGFPQGSVISDRISTILTTAANQTTDSGSTWTTTGLTTPVKQSLAVTFTPAEKGLISARVMLGRASTTMYFDPLITAGTRQFQVQEAYLNGPASAGGGETSSTFSQ